MFQAGPFGSWIVVLMAIAVSRLFKDFIFMKKVLYYLAQISVLLCSLMLGFVSTPELAILCYSSLLIGFLLMLAYAVATKTNWAGFFLYASVSSQ